MEETKANQNKLINTSYSQAEVSSFMKKIKKELFTYFESNDDKLNKNIDKNNEEENARLYFFRYKQYIMHEFNSTIVNMIILYINRINSYGKQYKSEINFIHKIINLFKHLLINEIEVACFTLLLEKIGWNYKKMEQWIYFTIIGISAKKLCGNERDLSLIINYFSRTNEKFIEEYTSFIEDDTISSEITDNNLFLKSVNQRFIGLTKPVNSYCIKNYINIEGIIDKIVKMSQPYFKGNSKYKQKNKIVININTIIINNHF